MGIDSIGHEIYVEATPDIVFDVISRPEYVREWFAEQVGSDLQPGTDGSFTFLDHGLGGRTEEVVVVESQRPSTFAYRWTHDPGEQATPANSLLVTFDLEPSGTGTLLRLTETGFRARTPGDPEAEALHRDHVRGWEIFLPRLAPLAERLERSGDGR